MQANQNLHELMARVALRDRAAFEQVYRLTSAHLFTVSLRMLRNEQRAEENLQEAYVSIWHHALTYRPDAGAPMTWMINIVRNKAIDALRSRRPEDQQAIDLDDEAFAVPADAAGEPLALLEQNLREARVGACMQTLSAQQRQALALAYYRGMVHTEIADAMHAPLGTIKGWVRRGLDRLKACLEAAGMTSP
ncbi:hypothetical protein CDN99_25295 [Roseateles aquatilis]|uniref:RNA polymerase subunit sigma n=1 Tax=Roseateles aquatilis TaxID=431061 RepID=A0A246IUV7_9BURK|nr:sigma-70 family RNA polymerase sigma factor [Roseateles aquatilis]OWQ83787.1 hypothetical protein CDN99_25295 [Roseateles aquatilis]